MLFELHSHVCCNVCSNVGRNVFSNVATLHCNVAAAEVDMQGFSSLSQVRLLFNLKLSAVVQCISLKCIFSAACSEFLVQCNAMHCSGFPVQCSAVDFYFSAVQLMAVTGTVLD